jgi:pSer/pThr/pTyr-binding forkhead associated (FHA) protein
MTVCNRCGKENQDHYKFCLGCGAELTAAKPAGGGDVAMMKTMMADPSQSPTALPSAPLPGAPGPAMRGSSSQMPQPGARPQAMPGMPPAGPLGQTGGIGGGLGSPMAPQPMAPPPMGPPPGVPGFSPGFAQPQQPMAAPTMRRCPSCGSDVPPSFRFCGTCGFRMDEGSAPNPMPAQPSQPAPMMAPARARLSMTLIRPDGSEGGTHDLRPGENKLGRSFGPVFENDGYLSPVHALLDIRGPNAVVRDLDSLNGVFVKMTGEEELQSGQIIRIGQELLRYEIIPTPEPTADGTELMGSPNPGFWGKLTVIIGRDITGAAFPLLGESVTLGRERGEINFPDDGYVSGLHARVTLRDGRVYLADLGSSNGTFVKVNGERNVGHDSFVLLGQQLFRLNLA